MLELIKKSLEENSVISSMRMYGYIALLSILGPYVIANITQTITSAIQGKPISFIDIPVAAAGLVATVITMKAVQSFSEKKVG